MERSLRISLDLVGGESPRREFAGIDVHKGSPPSFIATAQVDVDESM
jgi:hypothetical protein